MLTAEAAGEMVRDRDLELWGFWNRAGNFSWQDGLIINRSGRWADEAN